MPPTPTEVLLEPLTRAALEAGDEVMAVYRSEFEVDYKDDRSPVTEADARAEAVILAHLERTAPGVPVIAEEAHSAGHRVAPGRRFFLVDPLDGTREFIGRRDEFTVNIALVEDGVPVLGIVYAPAKGRLFRAARPGGAEEVGTDGSVTAVAARTPPATGLVAVASRSHRDASTEAYLAGLGITDFVSAGSSLKFCLIAEGSADVYPRLGRTMEWDTAAGQAVLEAAGGRVVVHPSGEPLGYGKKMRGFDNPHFIAWGR